MSVFTFTLSHAGGVDASFITPDVLNLPFKYNGTGYPGVGGTCGSMLPVGNTCTLVVNFEPTAVAVSNDTITLNYNDGVIVQTTTRDIQGQGVSPALLSISDSEPFNFGSVAIGGVAEHTFTITNSGGQDATNVDITSISSPFVFKGGTFPGLGGSCVSAGTITSGGGNCTVVIEFAPSATGVITMAMNVDYYNGSLTTVESKTLQGNGAAPALLVINQADPFDFGTVADGSTHIQTFTVTNTGAIDASSITGTGLSTAFTLSLIHI